MATLQNFYLANQVTQAGDLDENGVSYEANQLILQVSGSATSFSVEIEGKTNASSEYRPLTAINTDGFAKTNSISAYGIYAIGASGIDYVRAKVTAVSGGTLTVYGKTTT